MPAAVASENWTQKQNWTFGTNAGNNITQFTDLLNAGWFMNPTPTFLNNECETYNNTVTTNSNANFQPFSDHCDILAIWNGGTIASAAGNGSISSLMLRYDMPDGANSAANAIGYYELTCQIPSVGGAWPAWWTIGHQPGTPRGYNTWGPEIDIFEFYNTDTTVMASTLHKGSSVTTSYAFMTGGTNPPSNDPPGSAASQYATYYGGESYNTGSIGYTPGFDFSHGYHRYGMKIDTNYNITIWVDDVLVGTFAAQQYCDDAGAPVSVELLINLAIGNGSNPVGSIDTSGFGGANNTSASNKFRLSIQKIQIWGP